MAETKLNPDDDDDQPIGDVENPAWTAADFARAKPFKELLAA